jgi:hypothetical protein
MKIEELYIHLEVAKIFLANVSEEGFPNLAKNVIVEIMEKNRY